MSRNTPHTPIFDVPLRRGAPKAGTTPGGIYTPTCELAIQTTVFDTSIGTICRVDGSGRLVTGTAGAAVVFDVSDPTAPTVIDDLISGNLASIQEAVWLGDVIVASAQDIPSFADRVVVMEMVGSTLTYRGQTGDAAFVSPTGIVAGVPDSTHAVMADPGSDKVFVIDISTLTAPTVDGSETDADLDGVTGVANFGVYVLVASQVANTMSAVDVSTPSTPDFLSSLGSLGGRGIAVNDDNGKAYVVYGETIAAVDFGAPLAPALVSTLGLLSGGAAGHTINIAYGDSGRSFTAVADSSNEAVTIVEITDPADMQIIASITSGDLTNVLSAEMYVAADGQFWIAAVAQSQIVTIRIPECLGLVPR